MKLTAKFAALLIVATFFVSCSSKQKAATPDSTAPATAQAADAKKADGKTDAKKDAKKDEKSTTAAAAASAGVMTCKNGSDTRTLDVVKKDAGCEVSYTKFGETTAPASSSNGTAHCESVKERIKTNLENAGFQCS